jgi:hypothetical protein
MGISVQRKVREIGHSRSATVTVDLTVCRISSDHLRDLDIEQMRRVERLARVEEPFFHPSCRWCPQQHFE